MYKYRDQKTEIILTKDHLSGGYFHLKVGGAKSSGNAGDPMLGVAVSGCVVWKPEKSWGGGAVAPQPPQELPPCVYMTHNPVHRLGHLEQK